MIGFIKGILRDKDFDNITVECNGVGFQIYVTKSCMVALPAIDEEVKIYTYMHVREDEMSLYGFVSPEEKRLFMQLISVSGVGSKTAIAILSAEKMNKIVNSIVTQDVSVIGSCKGIGKKTAERIIVELKDKIKPFDFLLPDVNPFEVDTKNQYMDDAIIVLTSLGLSKAEATKRAKAVATETDTGESIVAKVLHSLGEQ